MRRFIATAILVVLPACAAITDRHLSPGNPTKTARAYEAAVREAAIVEASHVVNDLIAIDRRNSALVWKTDFSRVLVVTWKSQNTYERFLRNATRTSADEANVIWVTMAPQVQEFCRTYLRENPKAKPADLTLRLKQYLGLSSEWSYDVFIEMWVDPADIFRPCVDPETSDSTCDLDFKASAPRVKGIADYQRFYKSLYFADFRTKPGVPWTGLGYTYDWGNGISIEGASEFILSPGSVYEISRALPTADYCRAID